MTGAIIQPSAFDGGEARFYHDPNRAGYFTAMQMVDGRMCPRNYALWHMPAVIGRLQGKRDVYVQQSESFRPNRRLASIARIPLLFADLDTYRAEQYRDLEPEWQAEALLRYCEDNRIPPPSLINYHGRGLAAKWLFCEPLPAYGLSRWNEAQRRLLSALAPFGADQKAASANQPLRVDGTVNSKTGNYTRVLWTRTTHAGEVQRWDFHTLADEILPYTREEVAAYRAAKARRQAAAAAGVSGEQGRNTSGLRRFSVQHLWNDRLADIRRIARERYGDRGVPEGLRNHFLLIAVSGLAWAWEPARLHDEALEIARQLCPTLPAREVRTCIAGPITRANEARAGKMITYAGKPRDPRLCWSNQRIIDTLEITPDEERRNKVIISASVSRERDRERHRLIPGRNLTAERTAARDALQAKALKLRSDGLSAREIAATLHKSLSSVYSYLDAGAGQS